MKNIIAASCLMLASSVALAAAPSYSYIEIGYSNLQIEGENDAHLHAGSLEGSFAASDHIRIFGGHYRSKGKITDITTRHYLYTHSLRVNQKSKETILGVGYFGLINPNTTWALNVGYAKSDVAIADTDRIFNVDEDIDVETWGDNKRISYDENGVILSAGLRSNITDKLELNGSVSIVNYSDDREETISMGVLYSFNNNIGITASIMAHSDLAAFTAGVRYTF